MTQPQTTLPGRCYWVIPDTFLAGGYPYNPGSDEPEAFLRCLLTLKIDAFVDLTEEDELTHYDRILSSITGNRIVYRRFAIEDYSIPASSQMNLIINHINQLLENGQRLYLHCRGGIGRTGTVVGCWLKSQGKSGEEALNKLAQLFSASNAARYTRSPETDEQIKFVLDYNGPRE